MMDLADCPACREGVGSLEHEGGWCVYVECLQCGAHTAHFPIRTTSSGPRRRRAPRGCGTWAR